MGFPAELAGTRSLVFGSFYLAGLAVEGQTRQGEQEGRAVLTARVSLACSSPIAAAGPAVSLAEGVTPGPCFASRAAGVFTPLPRTQRSEQECHQGAASASSSPMGLVGQLEGKEPSSEIHPASCRRARWYRSFSVTLLPVSPQPH